MGRLDKKIAIVTGGARGIGKATVEIFTKQGAKVVIWDVLEEGAETAKAVGCDFIKVDTTNLNAVLDAASEVIKKYGKIDILINNAGITRDSSFLKMSSEQWQQVLDVNLTGVFNCGKAVIPYMKEAAYGRIVNTASIVALYGNFGQTNYVATKAGIIGLTKVWAREFGRYGITSNAVAPGFIKTEMTDKMPEEAKNKMAALIPSGKMGMPEDIANAYLYLASNEASFVNGSCLSVDGGAVV